MFNIVCQAIDPSTIESWLQLGVAGAIAGLAIVAMYKLYSQSQEYHHLETIATQENIIAKINDIERKLDVHIQYCQRVSRLE